MTFITAQDSGTGHLHLQVRKPSAELGRGQNGQVDAYKAASSNLAEELRLAFCMGKRKCESGRRRRETGAKRYGGPEMARANQNHCPRWSVARNVEQTFLLEYLAVAL
ncbi:hypothetical protein G3M48_000551 [Beauveria asiatica]|uniref:Uncharacterized protein n=1 Tax=Beauveria asiatica TaxID=1069075 RepID=A0AAW0S1L4_9HYPO